MPVKIKVDNELWNIHIMACYIAFISTEKFQKHIKQNKKNAEGFL